MKWLKKILKPSTSVFDPANYIFVDPEGEAFELSLSDINFLVQEHESPSGPYIKPNIMSLNASGNHSGFLRKKDLPPGAILMAAVEKESYIPTEILIEAHEAAGDKVIQQDNGYKVVTNSLVSFEDWRNMYFEFIKENKDRIEEIKKNNGTW